MPWMICAILLTLLDTLSSEVACNRLADIYWNATNPIFRIDNTDHIIDVNKGNLRFEYDQVNIICPVYPHSTPGTNSEDEEDKDSEQYIIYNVSKEEYDSCRITNPHPRIIAVCDKPNQLMYFTITFRSFTPQPGGLEFLPGHDYYFVSTSSGDLTGLHQRVGGRCATLNMKVIFKVCCKPTKGNTGSTIPSSQTTTTNSSVLSPASPTPHNNSTRSLESKSNDKNAISIPSTTVSSTVVPRWNWPSFTVPPYLRPYEVPIEDEMDRSPPVDKNKENRDKTPKRERAKNEELVNAAPNPQSHRWLGGVFYCTVMVSLLHLLVLDRVCR